MQPHTTIPAPPAPVTGAATVGRGHSAPQRLGAGCGQPGRGTTARGLTGLPVVTPGLGSAGLVVHRAQPLNCETPIPALIGGAVMPTAQFYIRNHFHTLHLDPASWRLDVTGLVYRPLRLSLRDLHNMRSDTLIATLECAGNGRSGFDPPAEGEQWQLGAVSTAEWTGVPLAELLDRAGLAPQAVEIVFRGRTSRCSSDNNSPPPSGCSP